MKAKKTKAMKYGKGRGSAGLGKSIFMSLRLLFVVSRETCGAGGQTQPGALPLEPYPGPYDSTFNFRRIRDKREMG